MKDPPERSVRRSTYAGIRDSYGGLPACHPRQGRGADVGDLPGVPPWRAPSASTSRASASTHPHRTKDLRLAARSSTCPSTPYPLGGYHGACALRRSSGPIVVGQWFVGAPSRTKVAFVRRFLRQPEGPSAAAARARQGSRAHERQVPPRVNVAQRRRERHMCASRGRDEHGGWNRSRLLCRDVETILGARWLASVETRRGSRGEDHGHSDAERVGRHGPSRR